MRRYTFYNPVNGFTDTITIRINEDRWVVQLETACACCGSLLGHVEYAGATLREALARLPESLRLLVQDRMEEARA